MRLDRCAGRLLVAVLAGAITACAGSGTSGGSPTPADTGRSGALARVVVSNETTRPLTIAFRPATPPAGEVVVGRVAAGAQAMVAPVPAGEPIVLIARTPERRELSLRPRTFPVDGDWVWRIPPDAIFSEAFR